MNKSQKEKLIEADRIKNISLIEDFTDECIQRNCFDFGDADDLLTDLTASILSSTESKGDTWVSVEEKGFPSYEYDALTLPVWDGKEVFELEYSADGICENDTTGETFHGPCFFITDGDYGGQYRKTNFTHYCLRNLPTPPSDTGEG
jgi:hypothetical protein